jgi:gamma-glutamyltranspeptidase/glutathione hydrolase
MMIACRLVRTREGQITMLGFENSSQIPDWLPRRPGPTWGRDGMIAAAHPLAVTAGAEIQRQGGNAVDVAVASGLAAAVVMPEMCGLGGDLFAVLHDPRTGKTEAVMGSGISPRAATDEIMLDAGDRERRQMPNRGPLAIGVPGMVDAYRTLLERWGTMPFAQVAAPAVDLARNGFALLPLGALHIANAADMLRKDPAACAIFFRDGEPLKTGDRLVQGDLADTLEEIGRDGTETFYRGDLAKRMLAYLKDRGGLLDADDFAEHETDVSAPLSTTYRGYTVHQTCLPSQGLILLKELNIVEHAEISDPLDVETIHLLVEAKKLAFADRLGHVADPKFYDVQLDRLLSKEWAQRRYDLIDPDRAATDVPHGPLSDGDTTYLCTADGDGMMVSLIQSVSSDFGSGVVAGDTGVVMNNRVGRGFSLVVGHPNYFAPGKKTMHTLNCFLVEDAQGRPVIAGGTPGGDGQPQWNLQMLSALIDGGMDVQRAVDMPRWTSWPGTDPISIENPFELRMEDRFDADTRSALERKGHDVRVQDAWAGGGAAQIIARDPETGVLVGGSDSRVEGFALGR